MYKILQLYQRIIFMQIQILINTIKNIKPRSISFFKYYNEQ